MPSLGGIEFADEIVRHMDMNRACQADKSLKHFWDALREKFQVGKL